MIVTSQHFSSSQLRAARALLNWSRTELAERTGISEQTIHRFENNINEPEIRTQQSLRRSLEQAGIEFTAHDGVRMKPEGVDVLTGYDGIVKFFDHVYEHVRMYGGLVRQIGVDEKLFTAAMQDYSNVHIERMAALKREREDLPKQQAIIRDNDCNFECSSYTDYRWYPQKYFAHVPFYLYGDNLGIIHFQDHQPLKIIQIRSAAIAEAYRLQFDDMWERSRIPPMKDPQRVHYG